MGSASDADWDRTMTVNLRSVLWLTSLVIPGMAERRDGSVIIVSSIAGLRGNTALGLYGVSKAGSAQLARNLAVEWGSIKHTSECDLAGRDRDAVRTTDPGRPRRDGAANRNDTPASASVSQTRSRGWRCCLPRPPVRS
jgi:NAD(P)-dependent dehydrogenase (short-subunit alcohol dehydrogenase family)